MHHACARVFVIWEYARIKVKLHFRSNSEMPGGFWRLPPRVQSGLPRTTYPNDLQKSTANERKNQINCNYVGDYKGERCHALNSQKTSGHSLLMCRAEDELEQRRWERNTLWLTLWLLSRGWDTGISPKHSNSAISHRIVIRYRCRRMLFFLLNYTFSRRRAVRG